MFWVNFDVMPDTDWGIKQRAKIVNRWALAIMAGLILLWWAFTPIKSFDSAHAHQECSRDR